MRTKKPQFTQSFLLALILASIALGLPTQLRAGDNQGVKGLRIFLRLFATGELISDLRDLQAMRNLPEGSLAPIHEFRAPESAGAVTRSAPLLAELIAEADRRLGELGDGGENNPRAVTFLHDGVIIPDHILFQAAYFKLHGFNVQLIRRGRENDTQKAQVIRDLNESVNHVLVARILEKARANPETRPLVEDGDISEQRVLRWLKNMWSWFELKLGAPKGIQLMMFLDNHTGITRPVGKQGKILAMGALAGVLVSACALLSFQQEALTDPDINMRAGLIATFISQVFFTYFNRALGSFMTQFKTITRDRRRELETRRVPFWFLSLTRSGVANFFIQAALYGISAATSWDFLIANLLNASGRLFGKNLPTLWMAKHQKHNNGNEDTNCRRLGDDKVEWLGFIWRVGWQSLSIAALLNTPIIFDIAFWSLAGVGVLSEAWVHFVGRFSPFPNERDYRAAKEKARHDELEEKRPGLFGRLVRWIVPERGRRFFSALGVRWSRVVSRVWKQSRKDLVNVLYRLGIYEPRQDCTDVLYGQMPEHIQQLLKKRDEGNISEDEVRQLTRSGFL